MIIYDVVLSFAGEDRKIVEDIAYILQKNNVKVFYDKFEVSNLWGKDLYQYLNDIYKNKARFCIIFFSKNYVKKEWTKHELKSAQARAFETEEYILPIYLDDVHVPGINKTIGHLNFNEYTKEDIVRLIIEKLENNQDKKALYNELIEHLTDLVVSFVLIGTTDDVQIFHELKNEFKNFLLNYAFDLHREIFWSSFSLIEDVEHKLAARIEKNDTIDNNGIQNMTNAVNVYSKYKKMIQIIQLYIDSNFDNNMNFFSVCENHGFFNRESNEELNLIINEIIELLKQG